MKAAILENYHKDVVVKEVEMPKMGPHDILVKIHTAGVNPLDNMIIHKEVNLIVPYSMPLVMGNEFVGTIERLGTYVKGFQIGDRVYGRMPLNRIGAFAQYAAVDYRAVAKVPEQLSDEQAATIPLTALTAVQALDLMKPKEKETIFISGGTGSLGAMAIPIAKSYGLTVITNGNGANEERVKRLGADQFIDYKKTDYTEVLSDVDHVLDTLGEKELERQFSILKEGGNLVSLRGLPNGEFAVRSNLSFVKRGLFTIAGRKYDKMAAMRKQKYFFLFVHEDGKGLEKVSDLYRARPFETSVEGVFSLGEVDQALQKVASGGSKGKTILKIY